ncbi:MAG: T9SS type A sorting domain-containing protein [Bacteroidales bacterium]|jgi:hypothetical protein|nr:T9SS type A sorting domain-containing protein [Bacteroidales bacterium]NCU34497.1 T9SS type A sorting domain-containing protein [Candidatus Falkowbacteria bacterium]MDD2631694.1 T9SS type A sorting domain-containing protein [Bacteroidales bacterium]MDD3130753.1 T9SS type A sorting domain-containing protein [Bacteroidales bacterium]MDD3525850.1 T9SS type A sorting domain-containing protein [Bacteroidales bacterium]
MIRKRLNIAVLLILVLRSFFLTAQTPTWEVVIDSQADEILTDITTGNQGTAYVSYYVEHPVTGEKRSIVAQYDLYGTETARRELGLPYRDITIEKVFVNDDKTLDVIAIFHDVEYFEAGIALYRMTHDLMVLDTVTYSFPSSDMFFGAGASKNEDEILVYGGYGDNGSTMLKAFAYAFDFDYDSVKAVRFGQEWDVAYYEDMRRLPSGGYFAANPLLSRYEHLSSAFELVEYYPMSDFIWNPLSVQWDSDHSFYAAARSHNPDSLWNIVFYHQEHPFDTTGTVLHYWGNSDTIDFLAIASGISFRNYDSIFIGATHNINIGDLYYSTQDSWFVILQTDSSLNVRWERFYGGDAYYILNNVVATPDGGCLIGGWRYDYHNTSSQQNDVVLFKLNNQGLITGDSELSGLETKEAVVFPNPGNEVLIVRVGVQYQRSLFVLFDLNGRQMLQHEINASQAAISTSHLNSGTYLYRITSPDGLYETGKWIKQ